MRLHELKPAPGAARKRKRVGRGGSSHGNYCGRGVKGQRARAGFKLLPGFEGGRTPLWKRLPKRGFKNPFRKEYALINLEVLDRVFEDGAEVTPEVLQERGVVKQLKAGLKVLGRGGLTKKLTIKAHRFSASALEKIRAAGGRAIALEPQPAEEQGEAEAEAEDQGRDEGT